jgi:hypothetical protein
MDKGNQESVFVQAPVYAYPVIIGSGRMPVVPEYALSGTRNRKVYFITVKIIKHFS